SRELMTAEANAAVAGAFDGGATNVVVNDSHGDMYNLLPERLDARAELIIGSPKTLSMMQGFGPDFEVALFVGYHAAAGTQAAVRPRSRRRKYQRRRPVRTGSGNGPGGTADGSLRGAGLPGGLPVPARLDVPGGQRGASLRGHLKARIRDRTPLHGNLRSRHAKSDA